MPRLTTIYTRTGDDGTTALGTRRRVPKDHLRIEAYGLVDELNAQIGVVLAQGVNERLMEMLPQVQNDLFHMGSDLAFPEDEKEEFLVPRLAETHITAMENWIDELNEQVGPLENFILPGGALGAAHLHVARTVCRRVERGLVSLAAHEPVGEVNLSYLNRLSDLLFVMARFENKQKGIEEPLWDTGKEGQ